MKRLIILSMFSILLFASCDMGNLTHKAVVHNEPLRIEVLPLYSAKNAGEVHKIEHDANVFANKLASNLSTMINKTCDVVQLPAQQIPSKYKCGSKYRADSIICNQNKYYKNGKVICICYTNDDIATTVHGVNNYGIIGLGFRPGKVCVISTHRIHFDDAWKAGSHEILHNLGLPHCKNDDPHCIMCDAKGKSPHFELKDDLCEECRKSLNLN